MSGLKTVLDLCGGTGAWSKYYRENGYNVIIVDPLADDVDNATIVRQDVRLYVPPKDVHGILAAPPCSDLSGSGARWWESKGQGALLNALSMVDACIRIVAVTKPVWWVLENPVGRLSTYLGKPNLIFDPFEYGTPTKKRTCLWGNYTPPQKNIVEPTLGQVVWRMGPSPDRPKLRSITPDGFAKAFYEANK